MIDEQQSAHTQGQLSPTQLYLVFHHMQSKMHYDLTQFLVHQKQQQLRLKLTLLNYFIRIFRYYIKVVYNNNNNTRRNNCNTYQ